MFLWRRRLACGNKRSPGRLPPQKKISARSLAPPKCTRSQLRAQRGSGSLDVTYRSRSSANLRANISRSAEACDTRYSGERKGCGRAPIQQSLFCAKSNDRHLANWPPPFASSPVAHNSPIHSWLIARGRLATKAERIAPPSPVASRRPLPQAEGEDGGEGSSFFASQKPIPKIVRS